MKTESEIKSGFKFYHSIIPIITIPIFLICLIPYTWILFSIITDRSGLWGSMYIYYDLTKFQYCTYLIIVVLVLASSILCQIKYLLERNVTKLNKTFKFMGILIILIVLYTVYLEVRFVGKG